MINVNRRSENFAERPNYVEDRNTFDLSHDYKTTFTMGKLIPFLLLETLPGDTFHIGGEFMFRFQSLHLPIMHRVNFSADYFYVPNRIIWRNTYEDSWERFIADSGAGLVVPDVDIAVPTVAGSNVGELLYYMGFPEPLVYVDILTAVNVNAMPIWAFWMIWDEYFRNDQIQDRVLDTIGMLQSGANSLAGIWEICPYVNWNRDYYTSQTPTAQLGDAVLLPLTMGDFDYGSGQISDGPSRWRLISNNNPAPNADLVVDNTGAFAGASSVGGTNHVYLDIQETAGTIAQLRHSTMLQEWLERALRAGDRYADQMKAFWNVNPMAGIIDRPVYFGSVKGRVVISDVMTTADSAINSVWGDETNTGDYSGNAMMLESSRGVKTIETLEHGYILGLINVVPDSSYMQGIHKLWDRRDIYDFAWQQFALIGDEPVLNRQIQFTYNNPDQANNDITFGYIPRYSEYRWHNDIYTGQMRSTWISYHMGRVLSTDATDVLDTTFINTATEMRDLVERVFRVGEGEDEIFAHIYNDVLVERKLPKFGIPAL